MDYVKDIMGMWCVIGKSESVVRDLGNFLFYER